MSKDEKTKLAIKTYLLYNGLDDLEGARRTNNPQGDRYSEKHS
jgi:hypothetical protein